MRPVVAAGAVEEEVSIRIRPNGRMRQSELRGHDRQIPVSIRNGPEGQIRHVLPVTSEFCRMF